MTYTTLVYERGGPKDFEQAVLAELAEGRDVIVNLDYAPALETEDIRLLIVLLRKSLDMGGDFALRATRPDIVKALELSALDRVFTVLGHHAA